MAKFEHTITIECSTSKVFAFLRDFTNTPQWQDGTGGVTIYPPDKPLKIGSMVTRERKIGYADMLFNADVIDYKPNKLIEMEGVLGRLPFNDAYEFSAAGRSTRLKHTRITGGGWTMRLLAPFTPRRINRTMKADLERLKALLESQ